MVGHILPGKKPCADVYNIVTAYNISLYSLVYSAPQDPPVPVNIAVAVEGTRLEHCVQKIEDKLCSNEPYLAQLLKLDSIGTNILSEEKEQELR